MLYDLVGHEYFAAAHDAVVMVGGPSTIATSLNIRIPTFFDYLCMFMGAIYSSAIVGALYLAIFSRDKDYSYLGFFNAAVFAFYSLSLLITFIIIVAFDSNDPAFPKIGFLVLFCSLVVVGYLYKRHRFLISAFFMSFPNIFVFFLLFMVLRQSQVNVVFVIATALAILAIFLGYYSKNVRNTKYSLSPLLGFVGGAYLLFWLPFALKHFGVIS